MVEQITKTERQIKYHEQAYSGSVVPDRIKTIQVLYRPTCLLTYNLEKSTPNAAEQVIVLILAYLDHLTSYSFSPDPTLFQCYDHFYMKTVAIH